jgi:spore coat protein CotF
MKEKFLPWFLLFCALGLSGTAAYYSVVGLSVVFVGVALPVIIMGSFLEISKIAIATYLHDKWKETYGVLKVYLTIALVTLSLITSLGIYGLLSTGFQGNIAKLEINQKEIDNVEVKKTRFTQIKDELQKEKDILDKDISILRDGLSTNTTTQSVDRTTGQIVTKANNANRKSFEDQLKMTTENRDKVSTRIDAMNDSITRLDIEILDMESAELEGSELGSIKYISEISGWDVKEVANLFILLLIFVFDPLAITLVIATNQAFKNSRKKEHEEDNGEDEYPFYDEVEIPESYFANSTPQVTPQVEPIVVEKIVEVIKEVEKIVEVPVEVFVEKGKVIPELSELFEDEENYISADTTTTTTQEGPKVLRYTKNNDQ